VLSEQKADAAALDGLPVLQRQFGAAHNRRSGNRRAADQS